MVKTKKEVGSIPNFLNMKTLSSECLYRPQLYILHCFGRKLPMENWESWSTESRTKLAPWSGGLLSGSSFNIVIFWKCKSSRTQGRDVHAYNTRGIRERFTDQHLTGTIVIVHSSSSQTSRYHHRRRVGSSLD